jgi:hypothetical protein
VANDEIVNSAAESLPAVAFAQTARGQRTKQASEKSATIRPADQLLARQLKISLVKPLGTTDDIPVIAEENSTERSDPVSIST